MNTTKNIQQDIIHTTSPSFSDSHTQSLEEYVRRPGIAKYPFVFIVTYGRSGSTLLQGILNSIPGYEIWGENNSTLYPLFVSAHSIACAKNGFGKSEKNPSDAWYGADTLDPRQFRHGLVETFFETCLRPSPQTRCTGFKEIRYTSEQVPSELFEPYLEFIQTEFRGAAIIFNIRNIADTKKSGWWKKRGPEDVTALLSKTIDGFKHYASTHDRCFVFDYDLLIEDRNYCESLYEFLGESFDPAALNETLNVKHSYSEDVQTSAPSSKPSLLQAQIPTAWMGASEKAHRAMDRQAFRVKELGQRLHAEVAKRQSSNEKLRQVRQTLQERTIELRKTKQILRAIQKKPVFRLLKKIGLAPR